MYGPLPLLLPISGIVTAFAAILALMFGIGGSSSPSPHVPVGTGTTHNQLHPTPAELPNLGEAPASNVAPGTETYGNVPVPETTASVNQILAAINVARADQGLAPLTLNEGLSAEATDIAVSQTAAGQFHQVAVPPHARYATSDLAPFDLTKDPSWVINHWAESNPEALFDPTITQVGIGQAGTADRFLVTHAFFA